MVKFGNFEVEYNRNAPDKVSVRIETDDKGEVWLPKCDIARAYGVFVQSVAFSSPLFWWSIVWICICLSSVHCISLDMMRVDSPGLLMSYTITCIM